MSEPAPAPSKSESPINVIMTNDLKKAYKEILEKYMDDRDFNENKILNWINNILLDAKDYFIKKYPNYDLFLYCYACPKKVTFFSNSYSISVEKIDWCDWVQFSTDKIYSIIYFFFYKHYKLKYSIDEYENEIILKGNEFLEKYLEGRTYNYDKIKNFAGNINVDLTRFILTKEKYCRVFFLNEIYQNPIKGKFFFKYLNYGKNIYSKIILNYSNDSLKSYQYTFFFK